MGAGGRFLREKRAYYARHGLDIDVVYDLDRANDQNEIEALPACDAIHLSGGDTVSFLRRLKRSGMLEPLRSWAAAGGILIGTSAGAILMTPTIALHALFDGRRPEEIKDATALDLVPFEFFPHAHAKTGYLTELVFLQRAKCPADCRLSRWGWHCHHWRHGRVHRRSDLVFRWRNHRAPVLKFASLTSHRRESSSLPS